MTRKFHPVANIFPLLQGAEFDALVESIKTKGLLNPIWLHPDGSIIDGRNRYRACLKAGVEPRFQKWNGKGSLVAFVVAQNLHRRHLTGTQRALLAKKLMPLLAAEAKVRQLSGLKRGKQRATPVTQKIGERKKHSGEAVAEAAKIAGTNRNYVATLEKIEKEAPEVFQQIENGLIELPKAKRRMAQVVAARKLDAAKALRRPDKDRCALQVGRMEEFLAKARNIDAIVTDPPYGRQFIPLYGELARLAAKALRPNGVLAVMCGQYYLPEVLVAMSQHMKYRWLLTCLTPGPSTAVWENANVNSNFKPILVFGGGKRIVDDVVLSNAQDKTYHEWGQSESSMERLVERLSDPDQLVCDPFLGAGTTAVACLKLHRRVIGCDIDAKLVKTAENRCKLESANFVLTKWCSLAS